MAARLARTIAIEFMADFALAIGQGTVVRCGGKGLRLALIGRCSTRCVLQVSDSPAGSRGKDRDRGGGCTKKSTPAAAEHWLSVCGRHWIRSDVPCRPHRPHSTRTSHRGSRRASNTELLKLDCITCSAFYWSPQFYTMTSKELSGLVFVKTPPFRVWLRTVYDCW